MEFSTFRPVFLYTDLLLLMLVCCAFVFSFFAGRRDYYRSAWNQIRRRRLPMLCAGVVSLYVAIALLDSVHFQVRATDTALDAPQVDGTGQAIYAPEVLSLLDLACSGLRAREEKTFSAPFAIHQFTKELVEGSDGNFGRDYPRLEHGGRHLIDPTQRRGDLVSKVVGAVIVGTGAGLFAMLLSLTVVGLRHRIQGGSQPLRAAKGSVGLGLFLGGVTLVAVAATVLSADYHVFGTDQVGQDVLYRALKGCRIGLVIGSLTTLIATPMAILLGIAAGYFGGWVDDVVQYVYTTLSSIPEILLIAAAMLIVSTRASAGYTTLDADIRLVWLCAVMGIVGWTGLCRLIRGETLKLRESEYVQAAEALGVSAIKTMLRHILPNVTHIILISVLLRFSGLVLTEAILAYVGIGVHPSMDSWGKMINGARLDIARDPIVWWNLLAAFLFMFGLVLPANIFGDAVRDALDPRLKSAGEPEP
jgi:peptide/nickel transport system permease protein